MAESTNNEWRKKVGKRLQQLRKSAGYSSAEKFASAMGFNKNTYTQYEQGLSGFNYEQAWKMADLLHCSLDDLGGREWPPGGAGSPLAPDEREVVDSYRRTAEDDKAAFIQTARTYAYAGDAKREGAAEPAEVAREDVETSDL